MKPYSLTQRAELYAQEFPKWPASHPLVTHQGDRDWLAANWTLGNDYRARSKLYGAYPPNYLKRVMSMYPDAENVLHLFSGSLPPGPYTRVDLIQPADIKGNAEEVSKLIPAASVDLCLVDPPYSKEDAKKYGTKMVNRKKVLHELFKVMQPGGHVVWLDTMYPMFTKKEFHVCGFITIVRCTNHRFRVATIFEKA